MYHSMLNEWRPSSPAHLLWMLIEWLWRVRHAHVREVDPTRSSVHLDGGLWDNFSWAGYLVLVYCCVTILWSFFRFPVFQGLAYLNTYCIEDSENASNRGEGRGRGVCMLIWVIFKIHQAHLTCQEPSVKWRTHVQFLMHPSQRGTYH